MININTQRKLEALEVIVQSLVEQQYPEHKRPYLDMPIALCEGLKKLREIKEEEARDK